MATIQELLRQGMDNLVSSIRSKLLSLGRNASGRTSRSLSVKYEGNDRATLWGASHFNVLEQGRRGGRVPFGFHQIIRQWILDKGISVRAIPAKTKRAKKSPYERGLDSMAGAIAYTIMKKGTRLYRNKQFDDIYTSAIDETVKSLSVSMPSAVGIEFDSINNKFAKEK